MAVYTGTYAYSRDSLLTLQVMNMMNDAALISSSTADVIRFGMAKQYFNVVVVEGLYANGKKAAELRVEIDWRLHQVKVGGGGKEIRVPHNWDNGYAPSMREAVKCFNQACSDVGLTRTWFVIYNPAFDENKLDAELGFSSVPAHEWVSKPVSDVFDFGPLEEMKLRVSLAI